METDELRQRLVALHLEIKEVHAEIQAQSVLIYAMVMNNPDSQKVLEVLDFALLQMESKIEDQTADAGAIRLAFAAVVRLRDNYLDGARRGQTRT